MRARLLCLALAFAFAAGAQTVDPIEQIREQQKTLTVELDQGILRFTPRETALIRKDQARVQAIIGGKATLADLNVAERVELDNALERINARVIATRQASEDRDVCRYERTTGSKMRKLDCMTAADRQNHREGARAYMEKPRVCMPPGCGQ